VNLINVKSKNQISPKFASVDDASTLTGLSKTTIRRACYGGQIASAKVGTRLLVSLDSLEQFLSARLRPALPGPAAVARS
jgi:excisionase family DNA binding protein